MLIYLPNLHRVVYIYLLNLLQGGVVLHTQFTTTMVIAPFSTMVIAPFPKLSQKNVQLLKLSFQYSHFVTPLKNYQQTKVPLQDTMPITAKLTRQTCYRRTRWLAYGNYQGLTTLLKRSLINSHKISYTLMRKNRNLSAIIPQPVICVFRLISYPIRKSTGIDKTANR